MTNRKIEIRRATKADARPAFDVCMLAMADEFKRANLEWKMEPEQFWKGLAPLYRHLAEHCAEWWVAQAVSDGKLIGYARSVERGDLFELSEFFIEPGQQSAGLGRELIERAFPVGRGRVRLILATLDERALARYFRADTVARFPLAMMSAAPRPSEAIELEASVATLDDVEQLDAIERAVVGHSRAHEYPWLLEEREGFLYKRNGTVVGYGFLGSFGQGPVAALEPELQRSILLHLEGRAHARGLEQISFVVPTINQVAVTHLLARGFRIDPPLNLFMSNEPFGHFDRFVSYGPPVIL
ncbi:MAG TPA: GNAT family N-acetyltransferase [Polyangiales bacterium]|nr:GNAT family N-acetyltransferase [Polyangiales bacterium]